MRRLPLAYECDRRWSEMDGGPTVRNCQDCDRDVVNLSSLNEASARAFLAACTTKVCVRYQHRRGRIVFARVRRALAVAAAALLLTPAAARADTTPPPPPGRRSQTPDKKQHPNPPPRKKQISEDVGW